MSHRLIVQWNQWLNQNLGKLILSSEQAILGAFLSETYGKHAVLIGVPKQHDLLQYLEIPCHLMLTPLLYPKREGVNVIESNLYELPIASGSVDVVIVPHTLELVDNPRQLLAEACRIVKPEGHLIVCGFNPYSLWGLKRLMQPKSEILPSTRFVKPASVIKWLDLSDFELVKQSTVLYSPPLENPRMLKRLNFFEWIGNQLHLPCGAVYVLMAQAKVVALTPIRLRWKQSLASVGIPSRIQGPTIRNSK